jgi:hypothetical protein
MTASRGGIGGGDLSRVKEIADWVRRSSGTIREAILKMEDHPGKDTSLETTVK